MFKIIYLPTAEDVNTFNSLPLCRDTLDRYIGHKGYYFFRAKSDNQIHMGIMGSGKYRGVLEGNQVIKKHLLEVVEVPNV